MDIEVDLDVVTEVLLADGWHQISDNSLTIGSFGVLSRDVDPPRQVAWCEGDETMGFQFESGMTRIEGPLTSILAVRYS